MSKINPLFAIIEQGDPISLLSKVIECPNLVNDYIKPEDSPVIHAGESGNIELVNILLTHGANANDKNKEGLSAEEIVLAIHKNKAREMESRFLNSISEMTKLSHVSELAKIESLKNHLKAISN